MHGHLKRIDLVPCGLVHSSVEDDFSSQSGYGQRRQFTRLSGMRQVRQTGKQETRQNHRRKPNETRFRHTHFRNERTTSQAASVFPFTRLPVLPPAWKIRGRPGDGVRSRSSLRRRIRAGRFQPMARYRRLDRIPIRTLTRGESQCQGEKTTPRLSHEGHTLYRCYVLDHLLGRQRAFLFQRFECVRVRPRLNRPWFGPHRSSGRGT